MSEWPTAVDPRMTHRLLTRVHRGGVSRPDHGRRLVARHGAFAGRSALVERLGSRGREVGDPDLPFVYGLARPAGPDATEGTPGTTAVHGTLDVPLIGVRPSLAAARPSIAAMTPAGDPVIQRKAHHGAAAPDGTAVDSLAARPNAVTLLGRSGRATVAPVPPASAVASGPPSAPPIPAASMTAAPEGTTRSVPTAIVVGLRSARSRSEAGASAAPGPPGAATVMGVTGSGGEQPAVMPLAPARRSEEATATPVTVAPRPAPRWAVDPLVLGEPTRAATPSPAGHLGRPLPLVASPNQTSADDPHHPVTRQGGAASAASQWHAGATRRNGTREGMTRFGRPAAPPDGPAAIDVERLADAVQARLLRRSVIERERRGALR